ncbi:hypothetical protein BLOT_001314 [Blomia tropicalis]|nr:hypothetical protein BLOT_001314 [Blomia tropicalis]
MKQKRLFYHKFEYLHCGFCIVHFLVACFTVKQTGDLRATKLAVSTTTTTTTTTTTITATTKFSGVLVSINRNEWTSTNGEPKMNVMANQTTTGLWEWVATENLLLTIISKRQQCHLSLYRYY